MSILNIRYNPKPRGLLLALPAIFWLVAFFLLPLMIVLVVSFMTPARGGGGGQLPLTLAQYQDVFDFAQERPIYFPVILRSLWIALLTTVICLVIGYPLGFFVATRRNAAVRQFALFLIILPFWTNFLVRTYALQTIIGTEGIINTLLINLGVVEQPVELLYTREAVILGLVYGFLPFMVLPIYASVERLDFRFVEAAHDLGANDWFAFWRVVFPMTLPGVIAGCILVFIPAIGAFVTPDLLGGTRGLMIGNLVQKQFRGSGGSWPRGSALSIVMMAVVMLSLLVYTRYGDRDRKGIR